MNVTLAYLGHSGVTDRGGAQTLSLAPNLAREPVAFDAPLLQPLRFREAISALHDVVTSDLRFKSRDPGKAAYLAWRESEQSKESAIRRSTRAAATQEILARQAVPVPAGFDKAFRTARKQYWDARQKLSNYLYRHDLETWRLLMPCDPVITVADDVVFFECFSGDESSYGCLTVNRGDGFGSSESLQLGTTNVDYSWDLYHHFQALRSYRETRFRIDPGGFEVATAQRPGYREEKIDLPQGWLRGFVQLQSAMTLPSIAVPLSRETVYSMLAWLKRHRQHASPRAIRFELVPGQAIKIVLEPWGVSFVDRNVYDGPPTEPIRVWGGRRLLVLGRTLPLAERFDVNLLGTGLPHFWIARMGEMRLTLGLSGWTVNDWTRSAALDLIAPPAEPSPEFITSIADALRKKRSATASELEQLTGGSAALVGAATRHLAHSGQAIYDLTAGVYRWRQILPQALGEREIGAPHEELLGLQAILAGRKIVLESGADAPRGGRIVVAKVDGTPTEVLIDADGRVKRGRCLCGYYRKFGLKNGPCRHMLAIRWLMTEQEKK